MPTRSKSFLGRNPLFRNFLGATTVSLLGTNIFDIAMPLYVLDRTHSALAVSMVAFCLHLPHFLMAPLTGYMADTFDKRKVMLYSDIAQVLCLSFLLFYEMSPADEMWPILITIFVAKSLMNLFETVTTFQLIPHIVRPEDLSEANSWFLSAHRLIQVVGPLTGGIILGLLGVRAAILINILSFGATLFFTLRMKSFEQGPSISWREAVSPSAVYANFSDSLRYVWRSPLFRPFIFLMFCWNFSSLLPNSPTFLYYFTEVKEFTAWRYGMVASLFGVLGILGYLRAATFFRRYDFYRTFVGSALWQAALASIAVCFMNYPVVLAILFGVSRIGSSLVTMGTFLLRQTQIPLNRSGGVNACMRMLFMSAAPLSALLQAFLIQRFSVHVSLVVGALFLWATVWFAKSVALASPDLRHVTSREEAA